ncbi:MAG: protein translocase subunit SecF [Xanthomonadaceae bacterium]|nr:protein translocase subunit SecF [Xanthomonadaceae bacterium]
MFHLISPDLKIDFLKKSGPFVWLSTIAAIASMVAMWKPGLNYGIDFTGGAVVQIKTPSDWDTARLRRELDEGGVKDPSVVQLGELKDSEFLIKVQADPAKLNQVSAAVETIMNAKAGAGKYTIQKVDVVGPAAGASLRNSAFLSIIYATLCIVIYITFRFDIRYAPGVLRALGVDVITTLGIWVFLQREFNLTVLAAMLTIAGYSCNDTIVIYDRIRDYSKTHPNWDLRTAINKSINQNLGRTVLTVLCTLFVVVSMYLMGGPVLQDFSLPLLIGFTISIPSTIFVANPMILYMEERRIVKQKALSISNNKAQPPKSARV